MTLLRKKNQKGFTLIEILVVIGIIAILAAIVLIAINPARQFAQARDSQRDSNVNAILNAVGQFVADNKGDQPAGIPSGDSAVVANYDDAGSAALCGDLVPTYMPAFPTDPESTHDGAGVECGDLGLGGDSDYLIIQDSTTKRITVLAPNTEIRTPDIEVTR